MFSGLFEGVSYIIFYQSLLFSNIDHIFTKITMYYDFRGTKTGLKQFILIFFLCSYLGMQGPVSYDFFEQYHFWVTVMFKYDNFKVRECHILRNHLRGKGVVKCLHMITEGQDGFAQ